MVVMTITGQLICKADTDIFSNISCYYPGYTAIYSLHDSPDYNKECLIQTIFNEDEDNSEVVRLHHDVFTSHANWEYDIWIRQIDNKIWSFDPESGEHTLLMDFDVEEGGIIEERFLVTKKMPFPEEFIELGITPNPWIIQIKDLMTGEYKLWIQHLGPMSTADWINDVSSIYTPEGVQKPDYKFCLLYHSLNEYFDFFDEYILDGVIEKYFNNNIIP